MSDLKRSKLFNGAALAALGREHTSESEEHISFDELWVDEADEAGPSHLHLCTLRFRRQTMTPVRRFYEAGLMAGGRDNGAPGERQYHAGYFASFLLDPDGRNVEGVHHGRAVRSAPAIEARPAED